ncbi:MAG: DedA family protein [Acidimicrobiia bacterium]
MTEARTGQEDPDQEHRARRRRLWFLLGPIGVLVIAAYAGDALTTTWSKDHPLALTLLNARSRILVLTTNHMDAISFYLAAGGRLMVGDPLLYLLGRWHGDAALAWVERKSPTFGEQVRMFEQAFARFGYPLVFLAPNTYICLLSGAAGMRPAVFMTLNLAGTAFRLYLIRVVGRTFESPIGGIQDFFGRYQVPLLILSVVGVALVIMRDRKEKKGDLAGLKDLAGEAERAERDTRDE